MKSCNHVTSDKHSHSSLHVLLGVAFRGRLFLEIYSKPSYSVGLFSKVVPSASDARTKGDKYLNRTKFILVCGMIEATMLEFADSVATFEVQMVS